MPDECQVAEDCNDNGTPDRCDVASGTSLDCNVNTQPDECDIATGVSIDCDVDGIPDECGTDCNENGVADSCDISDGPSRDCDANGVPDECQRDEDCNHNGRPDSCDLEQGTSEDCNGNELPDSCDIDDSFSDDCNENGIPDECEPDCNGNLVADVCDIQTGTSLDENGDGIPDECCSPPAPAADLIDGVVSAKNRFLSFSMSVPPPPAPGRSGLGERTVHTAASGVTGTLPTGEQLALSSSGPVGPLQAVRVTFINLPAPFDVFDGVTMWVDAPREVSENGASVLPIPGFSNFQAARLVCQPHYTDWSLFGTVHVFHEAIVPLGVYHVQAINEGCGEESELNYSSPLVLTAPTWGDTIEDATTIPPGPPNGVVEIIDVLAVIGRFGSLPGSIVKARADLAPGCLDLVIDISDILNALQGFEGLDYRFEPTAPDPCDSTCFNQSIAVGCVAHDKCLHRSKMAILQVLGWRNEDEDTNP